VVGYHLSEADNNYQDLLIARRTAVLAKKQQRFQPLNYINPSWVALMRLFGLPQEAAVLVAEGLTRSRYKEGFMGQLVIELAKAAGVGGEGEGRSEAEPRLPAARRRRRAGA